MCIAVVVSANGAARRQPQEDTVLRRDPWVQCSQREKIGPQRCRDKKPRSGFPLRPCVSAASLVLRDAEIGPLADYPQPFISPKNQNTLPVTHESCGVLDESEPIVGAFLNAGAPAGSRLTPYPQPDPLPAPVSAPHQ